MKQQDEIDPGEIIETTKRERTGQIKKKRETLRMLTKDAIWIGEKSKTKPSSHPKTFTNYTHGTPPKRPNTSQQQQRRKKRTTTPIKTKTMRIQSANRTKEQHIEEPYIQHKKRRHTIQINKNIRREEEQQQQQKFKIVPVKRKRKQPQAVSYNINESIYFSPLKQKPKERPRETNKRRPTSGYLYRAKQRQTEKREHYFPKTLNLPTRPTTKAAPQTGFSIVPVEWKSPPTSPVPTEPTMMMTEDIKQLTNEMKDEMNHTHMNFEYEPNKEIRTLPQPNKRPSVLTKQQLDIPLKTFPLPATTRKKKAKVSAFSVINKHSKNTPRLRAHPSLYSTPQPAQPALPTVFSSKALFTKESAMVRRAKRKQQKSRQSTTSPPIQSNMDIISVKPLFHKALPDKQLFQIPILDLTPDNLERHATPPPPEPHQETKAKIPKQTKIKKKKRPQSTMSLFHGRLPVHHHAHRKKKVKIKGDLSLQGWAETTSPPHQVASPPMMTVHSLSPEKSPEKEEGQWINFDDLSSDEDEDQ